MLRLVRVGWGRNTCSNVSSETGEAGTSAYIAHLLSSGSEGPHVLKMRHSCITNSQTGGGTNNKPRYLHACHVTLAAALPRHVFIVALPRQRVSLLVIPTRCFVCVSSCACYACLVCACALSPLAGRRCTTRTTTRRCS